MAADAYAEAGDDALLVLTAAMLTPGQFPGVLGDDYPTACVELGLEPLEMGYGLVFGQDGTGARWTVATTDAAMVACALAAWDCGLEYDLAPDTDSLAAALPGWPLPLAVAAPGVPEPYDPDEETGGGPPLAPPDPTVWGPAQRRLGADEIAIRWWDWRDQLGGDEPAGVNGARDAEPAPASPAPAEATGPLGPASSGSAEASGPLDHASSGSAEASGQAGPASSGPTKASGPLNPADPVSPNRTAGPVDGADPDPDPDPASPGPATGSVEPLDPAEPVPDSPSAPPAVSHDGVRRALSAAEGYLRDRPPPGRVRTTYGAVRADGLGWSLVGRADDMAFVLLDDAPGEVLPVGRGPSLPALLEALTKLAAAPPEAVPPTSVGEAATPEADLDEAPPETTPHGTASA